MNPYQFKSDGNLRQLLRDAMAPANPSELQTRLPVPHCPCGRRIQPNVCKLCGVCYCETCAWFRHVGCK